MILAGDIGGTKTVIGLFEETSEGVAVRHEVTYPSREQSSLEEVLAKFAAEVEVGQVRSGCFGVAARFTPCIAPSRKAMDPRPDRERMIASRLAPRPSAFSANPPAPVIRSTPATDLSSGRS